MRGLFKRIIVFLVILASFAAILSVGTYAVMSKQNSDIEDVVYGYNEKYVNAVLKKEIPDVTAECEHLLSSMGESLTGKAFDEVTGVISSMYPYISAGSKTVNSFEKIILSVDIDRRYGKSVVNVRSFVRFDGWGECMTGQTTNINLSCVCLDTYNVEKVDGVWKISSIKTEFENK